MTKSKKFILALAAASLLASCSFTVRKSTDSSDVQSEPTSQVAPVGNSSQAGQQTQENSSLEPAPQSDPIEQSDPVIEDSEELPPIEPGSIFEPVKESPVNTLTANDVHGLLEEYQQKVMDETGVSPFGELPSLEKIQKAIAEDPSGLMASALKHNHFTREEVIYLMDAVLPAVSKIIPAVYGSQSSGASMMGRRDMANPGQNPSIVEVLSDPEVKAAWIDALEKLDLDHLFATISDMENDEEHPLDLAYYAATLTFINPTSTRTPFHSFEQTDVEIQRYLMWMQSLDARITMDQFSRQADVLGSVIKDDMLFPLIRLAKQAILRGLKALDPVAISNDVMVLVQYFRTLGSPQSITDEQAATTLADLAKVLDIDYVSDADFKRLYNLGFEALLSYIEAFYQKSDMFVEELPGLLEFVGSLKNVITADSFQALAKLIRGILGGFDENGFAAVEGGNVPSLVAIVENAYYALSKKARNDLNVIATYLDLNFQDLFEQAAACDAQTITNFLKSLVSQIGASFSKKSQVYTAEYSGSFHVGVEGIVQNGKTDLKGWSYYSRQHGNGTIAVDGDYDTSKTGEILIPLSVTFSDGTKWHFHKPFTIYPSDVLNFGVTDNVKSDALVFGEVDRGILEYDYEELTKAIQDGKGDETIEFQCYSNQALKNNLGGFATVGFTRSAFTKTLKEFYDAIDPDDPYGVVHFESAKGIKAYADLRQRNLIEGIAVYVNRYAVANAIVEGINYRGVQVSLEPGDTLEIRKDGVPVPLYIGEDYYGESFSPSYRCTFNGEFQYGTSRVRISASPDLEENWEFYLCGNFNNWAEKDDNYKLNQWEKGRFKLVDFELQAGDQFIVYGCGDKGGEIRLADGINHFAAEKHGLYYVDVTWDQRDQDVDFWLSEDLEPASSSESSQSSKPNEWAGYTFYLVGDFNGWTKEDQYALWDNGGSYIFPALLPVGEIGIIDQDGNRFSINEGESCVISQEGNYLISFVPFGSPNDGYQGFLNAELFSHSTGN